MRDSPFPYFGLNNKYSYVQLGFISYGWMKCIYLHTFYAYIASDICNFTVNEQTSVQHKKVKVTKQKYISDIRSVGSTLYKLIDCVVL